MGKLSPHVFVIDDDPSVRAALESLLRSVGLEVHTYSSAADFLAVPPVDAPACMVLDVRLPGTSGLELQRELVSRGLTLPIIFITGHGDIPMSVRAMKAGALEFEFVSRPFLDHDLLDAIQEALEKASNARRVREQHADLRGRLDLLTRREREVMRLVVGGFLNKQIAYELGISVVTVKIHRGHVMQKLGANSVADLVRMAERAWRAPGE